MSRLKRFFKDQQLLYNGNDTNNLASKSSTKAQAADFSGGVSLKPIVAILLSILLGTCGQLALKYGTRLAVAREASTGVLARYLANPYMWCALFLYGISTVLWIYSLSRVNLSYAYPMVALGYVLVCVFSVLLFKETMPTLRIAGLGVIILGVIMIAISA
jgi:multidrug transporter EmrE-like cation transporter